MSSNNITRPTRPGAAPSKPAAAPQRPAAPAVARPTAPPVAAPDPFDENVSTSGIPIEQALSEGKIGSQMFGAQPPAQETQENDIFADLVSTEGAPPATPTGEDGGELFEDEEDFGDDDPTREDDDEEVAAVEEEDPFADITDEPFVETPPVVVAAPARVAPPVAAKAPTVAPPTKKAAAPVAAQGKAFKLMQENGSLVFDSKLVADLSSVAAAQHVWDTLRKPYDEMNGAERYTRLQAGEILMRDRTTRYQAARVLAQAILDETGDIPEGEIEATMILGKDQPQGQASETLGLSSDTQARTQAAITRTNRMMDNCHNRGAGCSSMRLNHLQATGKCFLPDCPCKGNCQSFVEKGTGGEATQQGETKSTQHTVARPVAAAQSSVTRPATAQASAGTNVPTRPTRPNAATAASQGTSTPSGNPIAGRPAPAAQAIQRAGSQTQEGQGTGEAGRGSSSQAQDGGNTQQATQANGREQTASVHTPGDAAQTPTDSGSATQGTRPASETKPEGSDPQQGEEPIITGEVLGWIIATGGNGPDHADYWPSIPSPDMREGVDERRKYIRNRFVTYWDNAIHEEKDGGRVLREDEFDLRSTSYRVVLAANRLSELFEIYAVAPYVEGYQGKATDDKIAGSVGAAAKAYLDAHRPLPPGQVDATWADYLEYVEAFKDSGLQVGMLIHEFQQQQQTV